jgi:hypothetical protein
MAYVEAHATLHNHPKTKKLARTLSITTPTAIGHLLCLWWWCQDYAQDGNLSDMTTSEIAEAADWPGDPDAFVNALLECGKESKPGYLEIAADGALLVHDWQEYGGKLFIKRQQAAKRQANWRERHTAKSDAPVTQPDNVSNALLTHNVTHDNAYREEKRREYESLPPPARNEAVTPLQDAPAFTPPPVIPSFQHSSGNGYKAAAEMQERNGKLGPELRVPLANMILKITGQFDLANTNEGQSTLNAAHDAAIAVYAMGLKFEDALMAVEDDWYSSDFRGQKGQRPTLKQFLDHVSKYKAGPRQAPPPKAAEVWG